jgi:hypothetical protein
MKRNARKFRLELTTLILLAVSLMLVPAAASAQTCTTTIPAGGNIQAAIDAASSGDVICLSAGTYSPAATIVINKSLTLQGPQAGIDPRPSVGSTRTPGDATTEAIIDGCGTVYRIIKIEANDVIVDGVVVRNGTGDLVRQSGSYSGTTVRNTIVHHALDDEGIQLANATGGLMEHNYVFDVAQDGLNFADSTNSEILNNEVTGSNSDNGAIFVYDSEKITISGNYVHDTTANNGIKLYTNTGDITVRNNLIVNNSWKIKSKHHDYSGNGIGGYKATATDSILTIEHNTISNNAVDPESPYHSDDTDFGNGIGLNSIPSYDSQVDIINNIVSFNGGWGVITKAYYETWGEAPTNVFIDCNDVFENGAGTFLNSGVAYSTYTLGSNNIYVDPQFNPDYTLQAGSPCIGAACDSEDMGVIPTLTPMTSFVIDHAKIDFKKKLDDDKVRVQGRLELDLACGDGVDVSKPVTVTVGSLSETITMEEKGKKGDKWEYKRPKGGTGDIKHMTIDWKNGKFDIRMDKANLTGVTNPVTISIQIGDDVGSASILMREKKHHWDYKAITTKAVEVEPLAVPDEVTVVAYPNPIRDVNTATFQVMGTLAAEVEEIRVQIYDLSGHLVWEDAALGSELDWHTDSLSGEYLANGIYLYRVQVRIGGNWINQDIGKIAVLR